MTWCATLYVCMDMAKIDPIGSLRPGNRLDKNKENRGKVIDKSVMRTEDKLYKTTRGNREPI